MDKLGSKNFRNITANDDLKVGTLVKGFTYFNGDFHDLHTTDGSLNKKFGFPKLRLGVIVRKYSNNYFMVQFRNSSALKKKVTKSGKNVVNSFEIYDSYNKKWLTTLKGRGSYCMIIRRDSLVYIFKHDTYMTFDAEHVRSNESRNKKDTEKKYFKKPFGLSGKTKEEINKILKVYQFINVEINMSEDRAKEKYEAIIKRHEAKKLRCVPKEMKKIYYLLENYFSDKLKNNADDIHLLEQDMSKEYLIDNAKSINPKTDDEIKNFLKSYTHLKVSDINIIIKNFKTFEKPVKSRTVKRKIRHKVK